MTTDLATLQNDFQSICALLDTDMDGQSLIASDLKQEAEIEVNDFALTYPDLLDRMKVKNLTLTRDMLFALLDLFSKQEYFMDFHAKRSPLFTHRTEALNMMAAFSFCQDSDEYKAYLEAYIAGFKDAIDEGFPEFKHDHKTLADNFNAIAHNGQNHDWTTSYQAFLQSYRNSALDLSKHYISMARFNTGIMMLNKDGQFGDNDSIRPAIYSGLENAKAQLNTILEISDILANQAPVPFTQTPIFIELKDRHQPH